MSGGEKYSAEPVIENVLGDWWYWFEEVTRKIKEKRVTLPMRKERAEMYKMADGIRETEMGSVERKRFREEYKRRSKIERVRTLLQFFWSHLFFSRGAQQEW